MEISALKKGEIAEFLVFVRRVLIPLPLLKKSFLAVEVPGQLFQRWGGQAILEFLELLSGLEILVAKDEGKIEGAIVIRGRGKKRINVTALGVYPEWRRRGIATSLMKGAFKRAEQKGGKEIFLRVRKENFPALNLYLQLGFKFDGVGKINFKMTKHLS